MDENREYVSIFDTTLRDGEQSPGCSMNLDEKVRVARALAELGVDVMEAGFPAASEGDFEAVSAIGRMGLDVTICGLSRTRHGDVDAVARALDGAPNKRLHVFIATSPIHRKFKLNMSKAQIIDEACAAIEYGRRHFDDIEVTAEDAGRTEPDYLTEYFQAVVDAGASVLNAPDTVGYVTPGEIEAMYRHLDASIERPANVILSCHCHNDLGMAVANSLAAVEGGARQVECTINGIGERAGNCSLEELVMALRTRHDRFQMHTGIDTTRIYATSRIVSMVTGSMVQANKAIVGRNAFAHEAGIHQDGMLKHKETYEILRPETVGIPESHLVLGKHSGRHAFRNRLDALGFELEDEALEAAFKRFKRLADLKKSVFDEYIEALVLDQHENGPWTLDSVSIHTDIAADAQLAHASLKMRYADHAPRVFSGRGDGPVNAIVNAMQQALGQPLEIEEFQVNSVSAGSDAQGRATVRARIGAETYKAGGVSTDIVEASAQALLVILNRHCRRSARSLADEPQVAVA